MKSYIAVLIGGKLKSRTSGGKFLLSPSVISATYPRKIYPAHLALEC